MSIDRDFVPKDIRSPLSEENVEARYPMTPTQQGVMFHSCFGEKTGLFNVQVVLRIEQELQIEAFRQSWLHVMERHTALRTSFRDLESQEPLHIVHPWVDVPFIVEDWRGLSAEEQHNQLQSYKQHDRIRGFELHEAPLWRIHVARLDGACYQIVWSFHYIILDSRSQTIVLRDVASHYGHLTDHHCVDSRPITPYGEYLQWLDRQDITEAELYWRHELESVAAATPLPLERKTRAGQQPRVEANLATYDQVRLLLDEEETACLLAVGKQHQLPLETIIQGCWALLLSRYTRTTDVVVGVTVSGRSGDVPGIDQMVGLLINTLPMRVRVPGAMPWVEWMHRLRRQYDQIQRYEYSPLLLVQRWSDIDSGGTLVGNVLTVDPSPYQESSPWLPMVRVWEEAHAPYPLTIVVTGGKQLAITIHCDTQRFDRQTITRMLGHVRQICMDLVMFPHACLAQLSSLTAEERFQLIYEWNDTHTPYSKDLCIHQLVEQRVRQSPDAVAVLFQDRSWTYADVNVRANQISHYLKGLGVGSGARVAVVMERSMEMIPALLGILKAGGAYVPIEAHAPIKRRHWILDSLGITCVLTQHALVPSILSSDPLPTLAHIVCVDTAGENSEPVDPGPYHLHTSVEIARMPRDDLPLQGTSQDLAYIIFTSGSTGTPKGVMVAHYCVINLIEWVNTTFAVCPDDRLLFITSLSFDLSVYDIFGILAAGGSIRLASRQDIQEPTRLLDLLSTEPITFWDSAPAALMQLVPFLPASTHAAEGVVSRTLRLIFMSGDWIPVNSPNIMRAAFPQVRVIGLGGATEATVWSNFFPIEKVDPSWTSIPYGKPIQNSFYYILDENFHPCAIDVPGDLYIGGVCTSLGYVEDPQLTASKFIPSPFSIQPGARIYTTGDMARWRSDGTMEFLGRTDSQVKIRGYRIELGEIDTVMGRHPAVRAAATIVHDDQPGGACLVSYLVLDPPSAQTGIHEEETSLLDERIHHWQQVYETFDEQTATLAEDGADYSGWTSSYTGQAIPVEQMESWRQETLILIRSYHPQMVVEIGCGTGLLLIPLANQCLRYYGTDFSAAVLQSVRGRLDTTPRIRDSVTLLHRQADDLSGLPAEGFDTVIINSVIQYFPDIHYLLRVLSAARGLVRPGGRIIVGDVRSLPLLEAFHASVELNRASSTTSRQHLWQRVQERVRQEKELTLDPAFFWNWATRTGGISRIEISIKRGRHLNEMTMFRYQVVLHVGEPLPGGKIPEHRRAPERDWSVEGLTLAHLRETLMRDKPDRLRLRHVPNARVEEATRGLGWLKGDSNLDTVDAWRAQTPPATGVEPEDIGELAEQVGYRATISWGRHGADGCYTVLLRRADAVHHEVDEEEYVDLTEVDKEERDWHRYANHPLRAEIEDLLVPRIKAYLQERLPDYMVPSDLIVLDALPVTSSGKLDRRALPLRHAAQSAGSATYAPSRNTTEALLVSIYEQVLSRSPIGIHDDFFELGGHSLLAVQRVARIRQVFSVDLPVRTFFDCPTIAQLAPEIQRLQNERQPLHLPPLLPASRHALLPASFDQQRLWFLDHLHPDSSFYTVNWLIPWSASISTDVLKAGLYEMIRRHESLRTTFREEQGQVWQIISKEWHVDLPIVDLSALPVDQREVRAQEEIRQWWGNPFDLVHGPLLRTMLVNLSDTGRVVVLSAHHTVFDGYSLGLFGQQLLQICHALADDAPSPLPEVAIHYADYSVWQRSWLREDWVQFHLDYWKKHLAQAPELLTLPTDFPRPEVQRYQGLVLKRQLSAELTKKIKQVSRDLQVTNYMTMLAIVAVLLSRYSGQDMIVIGVPIAYRHRVELETMIGFLVNTVALCVDLRGEPTFEEVLTQVRTHLFDAQSHQEIPFDRVVEALRPQRNLGYNPIFQVMVADESLPLLEHVPDSVKPAPWMRGMIEEGMSLRVARFDLTLLIQEDDEGLRLGFEYNTDLFEERTVARMADHMQVLVESALERPHQPIDQIMMLTDSECAQIVGPWSGIHTADTVRPACFHELFQEQVRRFPDRVAVVSGDVQVSYAALDRVSNQLAHLLRARGVGPETLVGLCVSRSVEMVVGLLATMKAGGAYVPLDPTYPRERLAYMVADAQVRVVVTRRDVVGLLPECQATVLDMETLWSQLADYPNDAPDAGVTVDNLAYVIYTSGSTGQPKGVLVPHRGIRFLVQWQRDNFVLDTPQRVLQSTSFSFDISVWELSTALLSGSILVLPPPDLRMIGTDLADFLVEQAIENIGLTPSALATLPAASLPMLRYIGVGGEACPIDLVRVWASDRAFFNGYGPTEATVCVCCARFTPDLSRVHIGRPIPGARLYILDSRMRPVPVGVAGELYIGGSGVTRGYLGRPDLTAELFIADPFSQHPGGRLYRTGDRVRFLPDGTIEFLGRIDQQVKIRGFRIELGEIESVLAEHPQVRSAAVLVCGEARAKRLVAYVVCDESVVCDELVVSGESLSVEAVRLFVGERLPSYMVPSVVVPLDQLPLDPHGKLDRRALAALPWERYVAVSAREYVAARTRVEECLAEIWQAVLGLAEPVSIHDNFFALGGDSIVSLQVVFRAKQLGLRVSVKQLFQYQTIAELSPVVGVQDMVGVCAEQGVVTGRVELTPIQRWFFAQGFVQPWHFNQALLLDVSARVDPSQWECIFRRLLEHHDGLRARYIQDDCGWRAELVGPCEDVPWRVHDVSLVPVGDRVDHVGAVARDVQASLVLSEAPLVRAVLFTGWDDDQYRLLLVAHHLVIDVVSWRIVLEDVAALSGQVGQGRELSLPAKSSSWREWADRLWGEAGSAATVGELSYWRGQCEPTRLLPVDGVGYDNTTGCSCVYEVCLSREETRALVQDISTAFDARINDVLLTAVACALGAWIQDSYVCVDVEGHGREDLFDDIDVSRTVGWFTTISPVRLPVPSCTALAEGLKEIKEVLRCRPRRGIGYGLLCSGHPEVGVGDQLASPAQVSFNHLGHFDGTAAASVGKPDAGFTGTVATAYDAIDSDMAPDNHRPYLIDIVSHIQDGQLRMRWTYNETAHQQHTIHHVAQRTRDALIQLVGEARNPDLCGYSPSDFPVSGLTQAEINDLVGQLRDLPAWRDSDGVRPLEDCYPQTPLQQGLWFQSQYAQGQGFYHVQVVVRIRQDLDVEAFRRSWEQVMRGHPILRTSFWSMRDHEPLQLVWRQIPLPFQREDWRGQSPQQQRDRLNTYLQHERSQGFNPHDIPQWRMLLAQIADDTYEFVLSAHHAILDGWSNSLLLSEVVERYDAIIHERHEVIRPARPYRDYVAWLKDQDLDQAEGYWRDILRGVDHATPLSVEKKPDVGIHRSDEPAMSAAMSIFVEEEETTALRKLAQDHHLTLNTVMQGCWALLLSRYSRSDDVIFGSVVSGRPPEFEGADRMIGLFINTLPVRVRVSPRMRWLEWLQRLQEQNTQIRHYECTPLIQVQRWSEIPADGQLFESLFVFENYPLESRETGALRFSVIDAEERSHFPLNVVINPGERLGISILYDTKRFDGQTIDRMLGHLRQMCRELIRMPWMRLAELTMLPSGERHQILDEWTTSTATETEPKYFHELFGSQAATTPNTIAVVYEEEQISYAELDRRANQLAHALQTRGVGPEILVGLCLERSIEVLIGLLGILKAGGAYVPIDPTYPSDRLAFLIHDARLRLILTQSHLARALSAANVSTICLDTDWASMAHQPTQAPPTALIPDNLAYIIYTSGSTGKPKGVMVAHRCVHHIVSWQRENPCFTRPQRVLQVASYSFDFSVWEIIMPLLTGGTLHIPRHGVYMIGSDLHDVLVERAIENLNFTPGALASLPNTSIPHLRTLVVGGEAYSADLVRTWAPGRTFFNVYGPTETTVFATGTRLDENLDVLHMGRPITNVDVYILDPYMKPVPIGVPGELYIGGVGVTRGYLNRAELTAEYFVANPFGGTGGSRLYKSGDLVRYLPDGTIEFVGRVDHQVKIRGFRIELGEIETALGLHPRVNNCAVVVLPDGASHRLVAYVEPVAETTDLVEVLRAYLAERLPRYMVPAAFVCLDQLPLTHNGKLNRRALPLPEETLSIPEKSIPARTKTEALLVTIWERVLRRAPIGVFDDFFALGGHSLLAVQVIARIRQTFDMEMPVRVLFEQPTIAQVAVEVERLQQNQQEHPPAPLVPVSRDQPLPATFDQQRLWFMDRLNPNSAFYTIGWLLSWPGVMDSQVLRRALQELIRRHETLRTTFREHDGRVWQIIADEGVVAFAEADLSSTEPQRQSESVKRLIRQWWTQPFDLADGPLLRTLLIRLRDAESVVVFGVHHTIFDGYSIRLFNQELRQLYQAAAVGDSSPLPALAVQYADYAVWQQQWLEEERLRGHLDYWTQQLADAPGLITLPLDKPRPAVQSFRGAQVTGSLTPEVTQQLKKLASDSQTTPFVTVLSAFAVLLSQYSGQEKVVIGVPVANRNRIETEPLIGFLVNTVALCVDLQGNPEFAEVLKQVRWRLLDAQSHQEIPFERLVEELKPERSTSYSPIFQVMFTGLDKLFEDFPEDDHEPAWMRDVTEEGLGVAKFDIWLSIQEKCGALRYSFEYSTDLFEERTVVRMAEHFENLVHGALASPQRPVSQLSPLSAAEETQLLTEWNATHDDRLLRPACLHELFEAQARSTPDRIAVSYEDQQLSYAELDRRTNQLARALRGEGVCPESRVGICAERSLEMVIGLYAILKAGGAYVPLDPGYPAERLAFMVHDARVQVVVVQPQTQNRIEALVDPGIPLLHLSGSEARWLQETDESLVSGVRPDNLAYVIYTSGSTGKPKGSMLAHRGICNRLLWMQDAYCLTDEDRVLHKTPFGFDVSVWEFFWPLITGAHLHVARPEGHRDPAYVAELIERQSIRVLHFVPSMLHAFVERPSVAEHCDSLHHVVCSGEALPLDLQERFLRLLPTVRLHNLYGPTEASVDVSFWECHDVEGASTVPIGRPVANTQLYILNAAMMPVPVGVIGELYIGGVQLARGYLGRPDLTAERFVANPFGGGRLYATGDLARYRQDGAIEYAGRKDHQIKIRGHRIEVGEIESVLAQHSAIQSCLITVHEVTSTDKRLVAFYTLNDEKATIVDELRAYLYQQLPDYMIPTYFVALPEFPLSPNGKVDRKALPSLESIVRQAHERDSFVGPRTKTEQALAEIWMKLVNVERVDIRDDFFVLGGHSLLVASLAAEIQAVWDVTVMLQVVFQNRTLESLAQVIEQSLVEIDGDEMDADELFHLS